MRFTAPTPKRAAILLTCLALVVWPFFAPKVAHFYGALAAIYALIALSLVVLCGWTGQVSLGHAAFLGFGAYVGEQVLDAGVPLPVAIVGVGLFGAVISLALGIPSLRLKGVYLTIVTLAFGAACQNYFFRLELVRPFHADFLERPTLFGFSLAGDRALYLAVLGVLGVAMILTANLRSSDVGRVLFAIRDSEEAAQAMGIRIAPYKIGAFALSAALATVAGLFYAVLYQAAPGGDQFGVLQSLFLLALPVVGGLQSLAGALIGGTFLATAQPVVNLFDVRLFLASGVALILVILSGRDGVTGIAAAVWRSVRDDLDPSARVRYGSFVPEELTVPTNGHATGRAVLSRSVPEGTVLRLRVRGGRR